MIRAAALGIATALIVAACSAAQLHSNDVVAIDLTNAICSVAADSPVGQPFTDVICSVAAAVEQGIGVLTSDAGLAASSQAPTIKTVRLRLPSSEVPQFIADHKGH